MSSRTFASATVSGTRSCSTLLTRVHSGAESARRGTETDGESVGVVTDDNRDENDASQIASTRLISVVDAVCCVYFCAAGKSSLLYEGIPLRNKADGWARLDRHLAFPGGSRLDTAASTWTQETKHATFIVM